MAIDIRDDLLCGYWSARPDAVVSERFRRAVGDLTLVEGAHWAIAAPSEYLTGPNSTDHVAASQAHGALVGYAFVAGANHTYRRLSSVESSRLINSLTLRHSHSDRLPWGCWSAATIPPQRDRLILTLDSQGLGSMFYARVGETYAFATRMDMLFQLIDASPSPDWSFLSHLLLAQPSPDEATAFQDIRQVPPGASVEFSTHAAPRLRTHWNPVDIVASGPIEPDPDELRSILVGCVDAWIGDQDSVWLELSGGLDSSTLAWAAIETGRSVRALNYCGATGDSGDERQYAQHVCDHLGIDLQILRTDLLAPGCLDGSKAARSCSPGTRLAEPEVANARAKLFGEDPPLILTGIGSDHLFHAGIARDLELHDYVLERGFNEWQRKWRAVSRRWGAPLFSLATQTLQHEVARRRKRLPHLVATRGRGSPTPLWLHTNNLELSFPSRFSVPAFMSLPAGKLDQLFAIEECRQQLTCHQQTLSVRYVAPFYSEPLVQLALRSLISSLCTPHNDRLPLRAAMRGRLPDAVIDRRSKGETSRPTLRRIARRLDEFRTLALDGHAVAAGVVDRSALSAEFDRVARGYTENTLALTRLLEVEVWCRAWAE